MLQSISQYMKSGCCYNYIDLVDTILAFHAITGCDSVSQFSGHGKKTAWAVFKQHHTDLIGLGRALSLNALLHQQCPRLIHATKHESSCFVSVVRKRLCHQPQMQQYPDFHPVTEMGWMHLDGRLVPRLLSLPPIPKTCREITSCGCMKRCLSQRCSCRKIRMEFIEACNCRKLGDYCRNTHDDQE